VARSPSRERECDARFTVPRPSRQLFRRSPASRTTGIALAEIYDTTPIAASPPHAAAHQRFCARAGRHGADILIAGFVVPARAEELLIRAIGPGLAGYGVSGVLAIRSLNFTRQHAIDARRLGGTPCSRRFQSPARSR